jgi:DNA (cytosine-5)-methyltransferase 1
MAKFVDLYCGAGGLSEGFEQAGFTHVLGFDKNEAALTVARENGKKVESCDLTNVREVAPRLAQLRPDLLIGGPSCKGFSACSNHVQDKERAREQRHMSHFVDTCVRVRPPLIVMENVAPAFRSAVYERCRSRLIESGYGLTETVLNAASVGVPQRRQRGFLVGRLGGDAKAVAPYLQPAQDAMTVSVREHFRRVGVPLSLDHFYVHARNPGRRSIFSVDDVAPTVRGTNRPLGSSYRGHPKDSAPPSAAVRALTPEERGLLQTFPSSWRWRGTRTAIETMIGNAVPVLLARHVALGIKRFLLSEEGLRL